MEGLIQFLSYGGTFQGVGGVANGITSIDIGVNEGKYHCQSDKSLQLTGNGTQI